MLRKVNKNHRFLRVCSFEFRQMTDIISIWAQIVQTA